MDTKQVGEKLVAICKEGRNMEAIETLYSPDIVSIEAMGSDEMPAEMSGIATIKGKNEWWFQNHEVHSGSAEGPYPHRDRFAVTFRYDVTPKDGPMKGQRFTMDEVGLYTVKDGKIVKEEFFYSM